MRGWLGGWGVGGTHAHNGNRHREAKRSMYVACVFCCVDDD